MKQQLLFEEPDNTLHSVFFATRPDAAAVARVVRLAQDLCRSLGLKAKPLAANHLHVSLCAVGDFVGALPPAITSKAKEVAATVAMAPFKVEFGYVASFGGREGNWPLVLAGDEGLAGLVIFQQSLSLSMMKAGVKPPRQRKYVPHLTLMYTDRIEKRAIEPISWIANDFVLIDSLVGKTQHVLLGQWPLQRP